MMAASIPREAIGENSEVLSRATKRDTMVRGALSWPALVLVGFAVVLPVGWLCVLSFVETSGDVGLEHYRRLFEQGSIFASFHVTFEVGS